MVFKLGMEAQKRWRRLNGAELVAKVVSGMTFVDGEEQTQQPPKPIIFTRMRLSLIHNFLDFDVAYGLLSVLIRR